MKICTGIVWGRRHYEADADIEMPTYYRPGMYFMPGEEIIDPEDGIHDLILSYEKHGKLVYVSLSRKSGLIICQCTVSEWEFDEKCFTLKFLDEQVTSAGTTQNP